MVESIQTLFSQVQAVSEVRLSWNCSLQLTTKRRETTTVDHQDWMHQAEKVLLISLKFLQVNLQEREF